MNRMDMWMGIPCVWLYFFVEKAAAAAAKFLFYSNKLEL